MSKYSNYPLGLLVDENDYIDYALVKKGGVRFLVAHAGYAEGDAINPDKDGYTDKRFYQHVDGAYQNGMGCGASWDLAYNLFGHTMDAIIRDQVPEFIKALKNKSIGWLRVNVKNTAGITDNNVLSITTGIADGAKSAYKAAYGKDRPMVIAVRPSDFVGKPLEYGLGSRTVELVSPAFPGSGVTTCSWEELKTYFPSDEYPSVKPNGNEPHFYLWTQTRFFLPGITDVNGNPRPAKLLFFAGTPEEFSTFYAANLPAGSFDTAPVDPAPEDPFEEPEEEQEPANEWSEGEPRTLSTDDILFDVALSLRKLSFRDNEPWL